MFTYSRLLRPIATAIHQAMMPTLYLCFDVFVEHFSSQEDSGRARGTFLSIINSAYIAVPMLTGLILSYGSYPIVYGLSTLLILPLIYFIARLKTFSDPDYHDINLLNSFRMAYRNKNIFSIILVNLILHMFYASMVIYMPIFLHMNLGFSWADIGIMFTIMLTPFLIFELPLGKLSDALFGEKEILITGLIILSLATMSISFVHSTSIIIWTLLLFMTRVGASFVEIMNESYFFKKVSKEDSNLLSVWRSLEGGAYIIIPSIMSAVLFIIGTSNIQYIFVIIGIITLSGIVFAARIKDTL